MRDVLGWFALFLQCEDHKEHRDVSYTPECGVLFSDQHWNLAKNEERGKKCPVSNQNRRHHVRENSSDPLWEQNYSYFRQQS